MRIRSCLDASEQIPYKLFYYFIYLYVTYFLDYIIITKMTFAGVEFIASDLDETSIALVHSYILFIVNSMKKRDLVASV